jgi:hypothetical protein
VAWIFSGRHGKSIPIVGPAHDPLREPQVTAFDHWVLSFEFPLLAESGNFFDRFNAQNFGKTMPAGPRAAPVDQVGVKARYWPAS